MISIMPRSGGVGRSGGGGGLPASEPAAAYHLEEARQAAQAAEAARAAAEWLRNGGR